MTSLTLRAGRYPKVDITSVRDLVRDDLAVLSQPRAKLRAADRFKDSHHRVARLFAAGLRHADVMAKTGYSEGRISTLHADPAFQELIAQYRKQVDAAFVASVDDYFEVATSNMLKAERMIGDALDDAEANNEPVPIKTLVAIARDAADRFGYGKKQTNINVNVDFAAKLERARQRSSMKTIDSSAVSPPLPSTTGAVSTYPAPTAPVAIQRLRRRA